MIPPVPYLWYGRNAEHPFISLELVFPITPIFLRDRGKILLKVMRQRCHCKPCGFYTEEAIAIGVIHAPLSGGMGNGSISTGSKELPFPMDHLYIISDDESGSPVRGKRFPGKSTLFPSCRARCAGSKENSDKKEDEPDP